MHTVVNDSEVLLHLEGAAELDVLLEACFEARRPFGWRERRRLRQIGTNAICPLVQSDVPTELFLATGDAVLVMRAIANFVERTPETPAGLASSILPTAERMYGDVLDGLAAGCATGASDPGDLSPG